MFGKVPPPSNTPGPPNNNGGQTSAKSSCIWPATTGTASCLPCFSVEETPTVSTDDKVKPWRPMKDNDSDDSPTVVSEAPSNSLQPPLSLTDATFVAIEPPRPCRTDKTTTTCASACTKTLAKCSPKEGSSQVGRSHANAMQKCPGQNCSNYSKTGVGRSRRPQSTSTGRNFNVESCTRDYAKTAKKIVAVNREPPSGREPFQTCNEQQSKCLQGYAPAATVAAKLSSARSSETIHHTSLPGGKRSSNEDLLTDTCANYFAMSNGAMSNVPVVSEQSLHAHQKPAVPKMIDVKGGAGDSATAIASCEDNTCDSDFTTSTLSRDRTLRRVSNEVQQSCVSCLPQNLPTELQSSTSPRNYKDLKEKCRDSLWRPTETS
ncbi:uncharacterized protein [Temnothorax longispinosus]|uniref:uncharacterized protein n=1 Tax=Temnothorax longispinosus TaxID=300112 RepID=UPI003A98D2B4